MTQRHRTMHSTRARAQRAAGQGLLLVTLVVLLALTMVPLINMVLTSLQGTGSLPVRFLTNYVPAWHAMRTYVANSVIASVSAMVGVVLLSTLAGYIFARKRFPGNQFLFVAIIALLMVPSVSTLIPSFMIVYQYGLLDTRWALILPWMASGQVFGIFICRGFYTGLPESIFEAARIDGANEFVLYTRIALPLSWPIIVTLAIMNLINTYNEFLWPLLVIRSLDKQVVSVGLRYFAPGWGTRMAAYIVATIPFLIIFSFGTRYYIQGVTSGAIKA